MHDTTTLGRAVLLLVAVSYPIPAGAQPKDSIAKWFCSVLRPGFDFSSATGSFPAEKLDKPSETRKSSVTSGSNYTAVTSEAIGEKYKVTYHYQFRPDNVSDLYGFRLQVEPVELSMSPIAAEANKKWLRQFGKPTETVLGWKVVGGKPMYVGGESGFSFSVSNTMDQRTANWFSARDIVAAKELCGEK